MMHRLIELRQGQFFLRGDNAAAHKGGMKDGIDFVEGQPIFDLALVTLKNCPHIVIVKIYHLVIGPAVVLAGQMQRRFIMGNGDQWLHAILVAGSKEPVIKGQPLLIR